MKIIELYGSDYEMGKKIGEIFSSFLNAQVKKYAKEITSKKKEINKAKKLIKKDFISIYEEIRGRADGANVDIDSMIYLLFPEFSMKVDGCSTVIMKDKNNDIIFSHNEDERGFNKSNTALVKYNYEDHWVMGYMCADLLIGSCFSFNSYGLVFSSNFIFPNEINVNNISRYIYQRHLVSSKSISDLKERLRKVDVASSFAFNVVDVDKKKAYAFEKDLKTLYQKRIDDRYARANHFILKKGKVRSSKSSSFRQMKAQELINKLNRNKVKFNDLTKIMKHRTKDYYKSILLVPEGIKNSKTVANLSFTTKDNKIIINDYISKELIEFVYEKM